MGFKEYFDFDRMITVNAIKNLHYASILGCLVLFGWGIDRLGVWESILLALFAYYILRLVLERFMMTAKMHEELHDIGEMLKTKKL